MASDLELKLNVSVPYFSSRNLPVALDKESNPDPACKSETKSMPMFLHRQTNELQRTGVLKSRIRQRDKKRRWEAPRGDTKTQWNQWRDH